VDGVDAVSSGEVTVGTAAAGVLVSPLESEPQPAAATRTAPQASRVAPVVVSRLTVAEFYSFPSSRACPV
jgi:hypothetical protein